MSEWSNDIFQIESNLSWLNHLPQRIESVFLGQLYNNGVFNEIHNTYRRKWFKRRLVKAEHVGVWGWNSWCGIHTFPLLTGPKIHKILTQTYDVGFTRTESSTGLLPHAIVHKDGVFGSEHTYKCYQGGHGEAYNLDNILCWGKMAMEYVLSTYDLAWFTPKFPIITQTLDYILTHFRGKYSPDLVYAGIEGDWTECTDWELDNADVSANVLNTLQLAMECQRLLGSNISKMDYPTIYQKILTNFNKHFKEGGFWHPQLGFYIHGNDGQGELIHGDKYFESTANYFAILWHLAPEAFQSKIWTYLNENHEKIELPYPVLTNYLPRTGTRRSNYRYTVTNGDVWMVLGAHAAAARLQAGFIREGTEMFHAIVKYELDHGMLHNCIYKIGVNDSWDPEIANYGSLYAPLTLGILGIGLRANSLEFHIKPLMGMTSLKIQFFYNQSRFQISIQCDQNKFKSGILVELDKNGQKIQSASIPNPNFQLIRKKPWTLEPIQ